jgi:hypothetical protein
MMNYEKPTGELLLPSTESSTTKQKQQFTFVHKFDMYASLPVSRFILMPLLAKFLLTMPSNTLENTAMESNPRSTATNKSAVSAAVVVKLMLLLLQSGTQSIQTA